MLPRFRSVFLLGAVLALIAGAALVVYARWTEPITEAAAAIQAQDPERALAAYDVSAGRFREVALAQRLLPREQSLVSHNKLALLYRQGRYDDVIEMATEAPPTTSPHFWSGCAMFRKAEKETKPEGQIQWVSRAVDEFKQALAAAPDDWDTKYNYELTARLSEALRPGEKRGKSQNSGATSLLQLLRPQQQQQQTQQRAIKKVG
jgi:hypothetical protein